MTRSELIHIVAVQKPHLYHSEVGRIVDTVLEEIAAALEHGGRVELRGFGALSVRHRPSRSARNPKNGQSVSVEEKWVPFFKIGKDLHDRLNSRQTQY